jgi:hypothetical protein
MLSAQLTNEIDLNKSTFKDAWNDIGLVRINSKGELVIPNANAGTARLLMWQELFHPHPYNCRYQDQLLDLEVQIEDAKVNLHMERLKGKRRRIFYAVFTGIGVIAGGWAGWKIRSAI